MTSFTQTLSKELDFGKGLDLISEFNLASEYTLNDSGLDDMTLDGCGWTDSSMWTYQPSWSYSSSEADQFLNLGALETISASTGITRWSITKDFC